MDSIVLVLCLMLFFVMLASCLLNNFSSSAALGIIGFIKGAVCKLANHYVLDMDTLSFFNLRKFVRYHVLKVPSLPSVK